MQSFVTWAMPFTWNIYVSFFELLGDQLLITIHNPPQLLEVLDVFSLLLVDLLPIDLDESEEQLTENSLGLIRF